MTIYIDIIFLENLFMNYIILFASAIILKTPIKIIRLSLSSGIGSIYAVISYMSKLEIYSNTFIKIFLSILMTYIAFNPRYIKELGKELIIFYLTSFTFGGVAFALLYFVRPQDIIMEQGVLIGTYPIKIILAGGITGFLIITTAFKNMKGKLSKKDILCDTKISVDSQEIYLKAIIDTGNFLRDPISKSPVIVVEKEVLFETGYQELAEKLDYIIRGEDIDFDEYMPKIRLIPFSSLGKENGMLIGIKLDEIKINYDDREICVENVIMGIYDGKLSKNNKYKALIGLDLLEYKGGKGYEYFETSKR